MPDSRSTRPSRPASGTSSYFATERGRLGLTARRREIARVIWTHNSPSWPFDEETLDRTAEAFENHDYVDVVIHSYRHRLGLAPGHRAYEDLERRRADQPSITVPTVTLDGMADGNFPATDGTPGAAHFSGPRVHRQIPRAGHNLPQEAPAAFADAILELTDAR